MGLRYRKSIKVLPGVKLNISKSGISTSVGKPGSTLNLSKRGVRTTVGIPGTGLSYSRTIGKRRTGRRRSITRQEARTIRLEMKQKYGLNPGKPVDKPSCEALFPPSTVSVQTGGAVANGLGRTA